MYKMGDKILIEQIIETIKQHPVIYDSTFPCRKHLREALWKDIADMFNLDVQVLKVKWKNLRDCYKKHIRALDNDSKAVSAYRFWSWSKHLEFLRPQMRSKTDVIYLNDTNENHNQSEHSENIHNIKLEENDHTNSGSEFEATECISKQTKALDGNNSSNNSGMDSDDFEFVTEQPNQKRRRRLRNLNPGQNNRHVHEFDGTELIFLGYAKTIKKMPLKRQISVKMKIAKLMMEEELKSLE